MRLILSRILLKVRLLRLGEWDRMAFFAAELGVHAGRGVRITGDVSWGSEPYLITIGDDVTIADGVRFITHDGGVAVFRHQTPHLNVFGRITVGSNVFIGAGVTILPRVVIGDNAVIGAGSVVTRDVDSNTVVAGVPARVVSTLEAYRKKALTHGLVLETQDPRARRAAILRHVNAAPPDGGS